MAEKQVNHELRRICKGDVGPNLREGEGENEETIP
jgi:hypothetical protein